MAGARRGDAGGGGRGFFGYAVRHVDGNDVAALSELFAQVPFEPGKPSLVLDLIEEFRQPVVDKTVLLPPLKRAKPSFSCVTKRRQKICAA